MWLHVGQKLLQRHKSNLEVTRGYKRPEPQSLPLQLHSYILNTSCWRARAVHSERYCCSYIITPHLHNYVCYKLHSHGQNELVATIGTITLTGNVIICWYDLINININITARRHSQGQGEGVRACTRLLSGSRRACVWIKRGEENKKGKKWKQRRTDAAGCACSADTLGSYSDC